MNHGGIGVLEHLRATGELRILFKADILQTLSLDRKTTLEGIYYYGRNELDSGQGTIDFIFSPIPFRLWPKVARIRVRLHVASSTISEFSRFLATNGVSILHSEYSRSGYRFATWNFVVAFNVDLQDADFNVDETAFQPTLDALDQLRNDILSKASHLIFEDKDDVRFRESLDIWPITCLAYFFNYSRKSISYERLAFLYRHFTVECSDNELIFPQGHPFTAILGRLNGEEPKSKLNVYADISTTDVMLRISVIPSKEEWRFSEINIEYERTSPPDTSVGFCAYLTKLIPEGIKIWKLTNHTSVNNEYSELGGASLLLEDRRESSVDLSASDDYIGKILESLKSDTFSIVNGDPFSLRTRQQKLDSTQLLVELRKESLVKAGSPIIWDVFLSYSEKNADIAASIYQQLNDADVSCFMAGKFLKDKGGVDFSEKIREAILSSREMILLCSPDSIKREWIISEWAAAWVLLKTITPVLYRLGPTDLPLRLRHLQCVDVHNLSGFVREAAMRKQTY